MAGGVPVGASQPYQPLSSNPGNPDSITANYDQGTVSVRRGNGNGSFQTPQNFTVGKRPLGPGSAGQWVSSHVQVPPA